MKNKLTVAGLFSGCGGLDIGFLEAGYQLSWANEWDKDAASTYERFLGHTPIVQDIWEALEGLPETDVIIGGPPCQSFSLVGKRLQDDSRAMLVQAFVEAIRRKQPRAFVMENVPGLVSSTLNGVRLPERLLADFENMGYKSKLFKVLATDYFVPQRRSRILIIGVKDAEPPEKLLSGLEFAEILGVGDMSTPVTAFEALDDLPEASDKGSQAPTRYTEGPHSEYSKLMRRNSADFVTLHNMPTMSALDLELVKHIPPGGNYVDIPDEIATARIMKIKASGGRTTTYGRLHPGKPSYTINTYFNRPNVGANYHYKFPRLITVREALRLQSFPDSFTPVFSNQRSLHMQIGNAVPPLLARSIAESLKRTLCR